MSSYENDSTQCLAIPLIGQDNNSIYVPQTPIQQLVHYKLLLALLIKSSIGAQKAYAASI